MTVDIQFTKNKLVSLDQILAQFVFYAEGHISAVGGLTESDISDIRDNAYNFRQRLREWINSFPTYDGTDVTADFTE